MSIDGQVSLVSPYITVQDVDKAANFYKAAFRFDIHELARGEDGVTLHAELTYKSQLIMLGREGAYAGKCKPPVSNGVESPITLYVYTDNVDDFYQHAVSNQAAGITPPEDMFWGDRMCKLKDPDGYVWCFATRKTTHKKK